MQLKKYILGAVMMLATLSISAANRQQTVYMYGFAASFNDSTVYFTDIQQIDSAYVDSKTKFLYSRSNYSYQLRDYLTALGFKNPTCITSFALNRKDAEKKYLALRKKYISGGHYNIKYLKETDFRYAPIKDDTNPQPTPSK
ncbi:MAG: hypothetical protein I3J02_05705 [Prevotella sp.]|nr:hypothetical protein [Prevotella sp.]